MHFAINKYTPHFVLCYAKHQPQKLLMYQKCVFTYGLVWNLYHALGKKVFLQDQGGVGGFFSLKVFSFKYRFFFLQITLLYWQCQCAYKIKRGAVGNSF